MVQPRLRNHERSAKRRSLGGSKMSREILLSSDDYTGSNPLYFVAYLVSNSNYVNGTALEPYNAPYWTSYAIAMQPDSTTGEYFGDFPGVSAGEYFVKIYERLGGAAAT